MDWVSKQMKSMTAEELKVLAERITPPNWNISIRPRDSKFKVGTLNICLEVLGTKEWSSRLSDNFLEDWQGRVKGPMLFYQNSIFKEDDSEVMEAIERHGEGCIGEIPLEMFTEIGTKELILWVFVHELSHIDTVRRKAQRLGREYRLHHGKVELDIEGEDHHGPSFQKIYRRMIIRTEKTFGKKITKEMWKDLEICENREKS